MLGWSWLFPPYLWSSDARAVGVTRAVALDGVCLRGKCDADPRLGYELMRRFAADHHGPPERDEGATARISMATFQFPEAPARSPFLPNPYRVTSVRRENADTWTLTLLPQTTAIERPSPGQFNMLYAFGAGEVPISVSAQGARRRADPHGASRRSRKPCDLRREAGHCARCARAVRYGVAAGRCGGARHRHHRRWYRPGAAAAGDSRRARGPAPLWPGVIADRDADAVGHDFREGDQAMDGERRLRRAPDGR